MWEMILGSKECEPIIETYRCKLRAHTRSAVDPTRETPKFLGIIATPDLVRPHMGREGWKRDKAILRWDAVETYLGSTADRMQFNNG
jgi:hypothetical protein